MLRKSLISFFSYFLLAAIGLKFATINNSASPIWPASGVAVILAYSWGRNAWPGIFLAATFANFIFGKLGMPESILIGVGNLSEAILANWLLSNIRLPTKIIEASLNRSLQIVISSLFAPLVSALTGTLSLYFFNHIPLQATALNFYTWWSGDSIGILLLFWAYLSWVEKEDKDNSASSIFPSLFFILLRVGVSIYLSLTPHLCQLNYIFIICSVLSTQFLNQRDCSIIHNLIAFMLVGLTANGHAMAPGIDLNSSLLNLQAIFFSTTILLIFIFHLKKNLHEWLILAIPMIFIGISIVISTYIDQQNEHASEKRNALASERIIEYIGEKLRDYARDLEVGKSVVLNSQQMNDLELKKFIREIKIDQHYPGISGFGIVDLVKGKDLGQYVQAKKSQHGPDYQIKKTPDSDRPIYSSGEEINYIVSMIEPEIGNEKALGLAMSSESKRLNAINEAIKSQRSIISEPVVHIDSHQLISVIFTPVQKLENSGELLKIAYSPLEFTTFFSSIFSNSYFAKRYDFLNISIAIENKKEQLSRVYGPEIQNPDLVTAFNRNGLHISISIKGKQPTKDLWHFSESVNLSISTLLGILCLLTLGSYGQMINKANDLANELIRENETTRLHMYNSSKLSLLGQMASGIAHEINNPLAILIGKKDQLKVMLNKLNITDEKVMSQVNVIEQMALRIGKIVKSVKSLSRDGKRDPIVPIELSKILDSSLDIITEMAKHKDIKIELPAVIPNISIVCREVQIEQVILNLLGNSMDAIADLDEKWIRISFIRKGKIFKILLQDSGLGIDKKILEKIMTPFFTTKEQGKGTGLGLSLSKVIMQEHMGDLSYDPNYPNTTFVMTFTQFTG